MQWLGPTLLIAVFLRHNTAQWLPGLSPAEWFYALGGLLEVILCFVVLRIAPSLPLLTAAMWIGILEGSQVAVCGIAMGHDRPPAGVNECDHLLGWPLGPWMTSLYFVIIVVLTAREWKRL